MKRLLYLILCIGLVSSTVLQAQDPQFSQFFAAPLYLNPALTGNGGVFRVGMSTRYQWPSLDRRFITSSIFADHFVEGMKSGFGAVISNHWEERSNYRSTDLGVSYSYVQKLGAKTPKRRISKNRNKREPIYVRVGTQFSLYNRHVSGSNLIFGDQLDLNNPNVINPTLEDFEDGFQTNWFPSVAAGLVLYDQRNYIGFSIYHLNEPDQSFIDGFGSVPLERRFSFHGGFTFRIRPTSKKVIRHRVRNLNRTEGYWDRDFSIFWNYRWQGEFRQLDLGMQLILQPIIVGLSYRGIPIQSVNTVFNDDALVGTLGFRFPSGHTFGYSYDLTTSRLAGVSGGSHELTYTHFFGRPKERHKRMRCPVAQR